ncbi:transcription cofactor HES-6-like [Ambystoma mexicanum]|uniref:transcription cofactor HES-6-like n=1 Tax=Ambystoma mexicanum TaxID=8296 RepID=UPI0037E804AE
MASFVQRLPGSQQDRKLRKPLIERKRRERINNCLDKLKETVVGAFHLDQSKLEKADILEMTVQHLQNIQGNKMADSREGAEDQQKYSTGYIQCVHEVHNLLLTCEWMDKTLGARMLNHLLKSLPKSSEEAAQDPTPVLVPPAPQDCRSASPGDPVDARPPQGLPFSPKGSKSAVDPSPPCAPGSPKPPMSSHCGARMGALDMWRPW